MARILLVDDEKIARAMYSDFLTTAGHQVTAVTSVLEAKRALGEGHFDVVVTDLVLPEGDGMDVLRYTKENFPGIEVILITAVDKVSPAVRAIKGGAAEYLVKPVAPETLEHAVTRALTTRNLLRENASLRQYVSLMETGQRIATTLDKQELLSAASHAFLQVSDAAALLLFVQQPPSDYVLQGTWGLPQSEKEGVIQRVRVQLKAREEPLALSGLTPQYRAAWAFPATHGGKTWGFATLLFTQPPNESASAAATYLAKHLALGLRNLGRFAQVEDLAYLDDLTRLFNMRYLELVLDQEVKGSSPFSVLFLDLDYFKNINDTHGHLVGSRLLVEAARVLQGCVRENDVVVRYGGDEYVVLLRNTDSGGALTVAERVRRTFESHPFLSREGYSVHVTTCVGVASSPEHARDKQTLLDWADRAMYRGKKTTRNVVYMASTGLEATPPARHKPEEEAEQDSGDPVETPEKVH